MRGIFRSNLAAGRDTNIGPCVMWASSLRTTALHLSPWNTLIIIQTHTDMNGHPSLRPSPICRAARPYMCGSTEGNNGFGGSESHSHIPIKTSSSVQQQCEKNAHLVYITFSRIPYLGPRCSALEQHWRRDYHLRRSMDAHCVRCPSQVGHLFGIPSDYRASC